MITERKPSYSFLVLICFVALFLAYSPVAQAQNWMALPPYNTLWPLWSPALSPVDPLTGLPEPLVTELLPSTILPVEPALTWDPAEANPWLLYNTPLGMAYYDPAFGVNLWPPTFLQDPFGLPLPLTLPVGYELLPPTDPLWISSTVPLGDAAVLDYLLPFGLPVPPVFLPPSAII
ncbi:MAG: hypothetical protein AB1847_09645 [bacterium]